MHPGGVRSAMDLFDFEKSANLKHPSVQQCNIFTTEEIICQVEQGWNTALTTDVDVKINNIDQ